MSSTIGFSWTALVGLPVAGFVGFTWTVLRCRFHGMARQNLGQLLKGEGENFLWLFVIDAVGSIFLILFLVGTSPNRSGFSRIAVDHPWVFWPAVGSVGPLAGWAILRRLPADWQIPKMGTRKQSAGLAKERIGLYEVRASIVGEIYETAGHLGNNWRRARRYWILDLALQAREQDAFDFDDFTEGINRGHRNNAKKCPLPEQWAKDERELRQDRGVVAADPSDVCERMIANALRAGYHFETGEAFGLNVSTFRMKTVNSQQPRRAQSLEQRDQDAISGAIADFEVLDESRDEPGTGTA